MADKGKDKKKFVAGLDVGTTKVCAIVGEEEPDGTLRVLGVGTYPSEGLEKGLVVDPAKTIQSIRNAVEKAARMAGREVAELIVGIAGEHIKCVDSRASVEIVNPERGVSHADIARAVERAGNLTMPPDREILHVIPQEYVIDAGPVKNPLGQVTTKLEVNVHVITAEANSLENLRRCVEQAGYTVKDVLLESIASSHAILTEEDKELGVLLLDIGGGTTDAAIFSGGHIRYSGVIPLGGDKIRDDVAFALKISKPDAENVKKKFGCAMASLVRPDETLAVTISVSKKKKTVKRQILADVIEARLEDIFHLARERIKAAPLKDVSYAGVVLSGGSSLVEGMTELAEKFFDRPCRVGAPENVKGMSGIIASPIYATGVGLAEHGFSDALNRPPKKGGLWQWIKRLIMKLIVFFK